MRGEAGQPCCVCHDDGCVLADGQPWVLQRLVRHGGSSPRHGTAGAPYTQNGRCTAHPERLVHHTPRTASAPYTQNSQCTVHPERLVHRTPRMDGAPHTKNGRCTTHPEETMHHVPTMASAPHTQNGWCTAHPDRPVHCAPTSLSARPPAPSTCQRWAAGARGREQKLLGNPPVVPSAGAEPRPGRFPAAAPATERADGQNRGVWWAGGLGGVSWAAPGGRQLGLQMGCRERPRLLPRDRRCVRQEPVVAMGSDFSVTCGLGSSRSSGCERFSPALGSPAHPPGEAAPVPGPGASPRSPLSPTRGCAPASAATRGTGAALPCGPSGRLGCCPGLGGTRRSVRHRAGRGPGCGTRVCHRALPRLGLGACGVAWDKSSVSPFGVSSGAPQAAGRDACLEL